MNEFGKLLKAERKKSRISQTRLAECLHVTKQTVSLWECGVNKPRNDKLEPLLKLFPELTETANSDMARLNPFQARVQKAIMFTEDQLRFCEEQGEKLGISTCAYIRSLVNREMKGLGRTEE